MPEINIYDWKGNILYHCFRYTVLYAYYDTFFANHNCLNDFNGVRTEALTCFRTFFDMLTRVIIRE